MLRVALLFLLLLHCSPSPPPLREVLNVAIDSEPKTLDPRKSTEAYGLRIINLIFNGLIKIGPQLELLPDGAKSWKQRGLTFIFVLKDLKFSNGRKVTEKDLEFSFKEFSKEGSPFASSFKNIKSVKVFREEGRLVLKIQLKKQSATFLSADLPVLKILPQKEIAESPQLFLNQPFGTGPFILKKKTGQKILLERRVRAEGYPSFISFLILRDNTTRIQKILKGNIDVAPSVIPLKKVSQFLDKPFKVLKQPSLSTNYLLINLTHKHLQKKGLRRALSLALNRNEVIKYQLKGYGTPATSFLNPLYFSVSKGLKLKENLAEAKKIVQDLGLQGAKLTLSVSNNRDTVEKAKILISQWNPLGLQISLESYEWGTFYQDLNKGHFELAMMKWVGVTDPDIYRVAFHSENIPPLGRNRSFYRNKKLDRLLKKGLETINKKEREKIYKQVQNIIFEDFVAIPLWHEMEVTLVKKSLKGYHPMLNGNFDNLMFIRK